MRDIIVIELKKAIKQHKLGEYDGTDEYDMVRLLVGSQVLNARSGKRPEGIENGNDELCDMIDEELYKMENE